MQLVFDVFLVEEYDVEKSCFQKECCDDFVGDDGVKDVVGEFGEL